MILCKVCWQFCLKYPLPTAVPLPVRNKSAYLVLFLENHQCEDTENPGKKLDLCWIFLASYWSIFLYFNLLLAERLRHILEEQNSKALKEKLGTTTGWTCNESLWDKKSQPATDSTNQPLLNLTLDRNNIFKWKVALYLRPWFVEHSVVLPSGNPFCQEWD